MKGGKEKEGEKVTSVVRKASLVEVKMPKYSL
jgi:hypothetical protein